MKVVSFLLLFALLGLLIGYAIFGQVNNTYVDPMQLIAPRSGVGGFVVNKVYGLEEKRNNILIAGAIGAVVGLFAGLLASRKK